MTKQSQVWKFIFQNLQHEIPVVLLYVVESAGSSPGRQGFFMAVNARHIMKGSIGGGIMEHKFVEMAKELLLHAGHHDEVILKRQVHDKSAAKDQSGMICSGEQTIILYTVRSSDIKTVEKITDCLSRGEQGTLRLSPGKTEFNNKPCDKQYRFEKRSESDWLYEETIGICDQIHIIGGGHCALALSRIMRMMDFFVHVYDDRPMLNTMLQNEAAHKKTTVEHYNELAELIRPDSNAYVVIMTFGYRTDDIALRALVNNTFRYLGVLGSKNKIEKMFNDYRAEGWSEEKLASINAPIGMNIKSETPEEIAISIAAEIIKVKHHAHQDR
jgi:xanthine dehydrogenase accessory factor